MMVCKLEHYNIRTTRFEDTVRFYVDVLGMHTEAPAGSPASMPRNWIYDDSGVAVVHLTRVDPAQPEASYAEKSRYRRGLDSEDWPLFRGSGAIDHIAFQCAGREEIVERLRNAQVPYVENTVAQLDLRQVFLKDPNGITLELNFR